MQLLAEAYLRSAEEIPDGLALPPRKAKGMQFFGKSAPHLPLKPKVFQNDFHLASLVAVWVDVAGISHQGGVHELLERGRRSARRGRNLILRQAPPCIERHAEAFDWFAPEEAFKAELRCDGVNRFCVPQQAHWVAVGSQDLDLSRPGDLSKIKIALLSPRPNIRMGFHQDRTIRIVALCRVDHPLKTGCVCKTVPYRVVIEGLIHDEHVTLRQIALVFTSMIVF